jgi:uncharacterized DUF497 family protein
MLRDLQFLDFEWDAGNWPKCAKHGLSREDIEAVFGATPFVIPARTVTPELCYAAIGRAVGQLRFHRIYLAHDRFGRADPAYFGSLHAREGGAAL